MSGYGCVQFGEGGLLTDLVAMQNVGLPRRAARGRGVSVSAFLVRPYTTRKGDTLESIAQKRGM